MLSSWNKDIFIIIIGVQKISTSSWVVKILFPDVSMPGLIGPAYNYYYQYYKLPTEEVLGK